MPVGYRYSTCCKKAVSVANPMLYVQETAYQSFSYNILLDETRKTCSIHVIMHDKMY